MTVSTPKSLFIIAVHTHAIAFVAVVVWSSPKEVNT